MPEQRTIHRVHAASVKYGENPYQKSAGLFRDPECEDPLAVPNFELREGSPPSFNNYADVDRLLQTITHIAAGLEKNGMPVTNIAIGAKHGNMCGGSVNDDPLIATAQMLDGDPLAIFGGLTMSNFVLDKSVATTLQTHGMPADRKRLLDGVIAADVDEAVLEMMQRKGGKLRILTNKALGSIGLDSLDTAERFRYVRGGMLVQDNYTFVPKLPELIPGTDRRLTDELKHDLVLAWAIGSTSTSNTITLVNGGQLIGNGVGQQDRVAAAELALRRVKRSKHAAVGAVAYSDSFFPFPDGPQVLVDAGISAIFTSSGSINDETVLKTFKKAGVDVFTVPDVEGRGFYGH
ncbi:MAG: hypothetical protein ACR2FM_03135 [Candidatus Saccharimonadales bacterium]